MTQRDYGQVMADAKARVEQHEELYKVFSNKLVQTFLGNMKDGFQSVALRWQTDSGILIPHEERTQAAIALSVIEAIKDMGSKCESRIEENQKIYDKAKSKLNNQKTETREA